MDFVALKDFLDQLTAWRIPGNGVKVCLEGKEVFSYTSGYADVYKNKACHWTRLIFLLCGIWLG